jgi:protease-4
VKPVIVSMSDYAASGGYYIAVPADSIVAEPGTITGSIGVFGGKFNLIGLYRKLGFNIETIERGKHAGMFSSFRDFTPEEADRYAGMLDETYRGFVARVSRGRHLPVATVDSLAQGRVWDGGTARSLGLVDRLGGVMDALEMARARAHLPHDETLVVERFPRVNKGFLERMIEELLSESGGDELSRAGLPPAVQAWIAAASFPAGEALALLPWSIEVR